MGLGGGGWVLVLYIIALGGGGWGWVLPFYNMGLEGGGWVHRCILWL